MTDLDGKNAQKKTTHKLNVHQELRENKRGQRKTRRQMKGKKTLKESSLATA